MTLVAGFRCLRGGVLLCADRHEDNGYNVREVDKIDRIEVTYLQTCDVFLAGAGGGNLIRKFQSNLRASLITAAQTKRNVFAEHEALIQAELSTFHQLWESEIEKLGMTFIVVVAPVDNKLVPLLYRTDKTALIPFPEYCASGAGQPIADYFADRLFHYDRMERPHLAILAAFILREAERSASGVRYGNMVFIHDGEKSLLHIGKDYLKQLQDSIPSIEDAILAHWKDHVTIPEWLASL